MVVCTEPEAAVFPWCRDNWACPFFSCQFDDFFLERPVDLCRPELPCRWLSPVWCTVDWTEAVFSFLRFLFCSRNILKVNVSHGRKFFQEFKELGTMSIVYVVYHYFVPPVVIKAVVVSFLYLLMFLHLFETTESSFITIDVDGSYWGTQW